jgi:1-deoxy-D-xylulose-5-phosphate reductoisomerase
MRTPIGYALGWPARPKLAMVKRLDLLAAEVSFARPDVEKFPCLRLAIEAGKQASMVEAEAGCATGACVVSPRAGAVDAPPAPRTAAAPIVLNAANEIAVQAFLERRIGFLDIAMTVEKCLSWLGGEVVESLDEVFALDAEARRFATESTDSRRTGV